MKKRLLSLGLCIISLSFLPAFSQNNTDESYQQVLIPREVYVGDLGRIEYSFRSPVDLFALAPSEKISGDILTFDVNDPVFANLSDRCTVKKAVLIRNGLSYNFVLDLIPWKPGKIDFPQFDLTKMCRNGVELAEGEEEIPFYVDLAPVNIASIVTRLGVDTISPPESPILLPGTNYVVWFFSIFAVVLFFGVGVFIVKFQQIVKYFARLKKRLGFYRNAFSSKHKLHRLLKRRYNDVEFSLAWQQIMKNYLEYRFRLPFASVTSRRISMKIRNSVGGMLTEEQENAIEYLVTLFLRTDYIKFAAGSIDSRLLPLEEHEAVFVENERKQIVEMSESAINRLEAKNEQDEALKENIKKRILKKRKEENTNV